MAACSQCGKKNGHLPGCPIGPAPKNPPGGCPECGARTGHKRGCKQRKQEMPRGVRPGTTARGVPCPPHSPTKVRSRRNGDWYHKCTKCNKGLGWW